VITMHDKRTSLARIRAQIVKVFGAKVARP
jgi:hypothetical protein